MNKPPATTPAEEKKAMPERIITASPIEIKPMTDEEAERMAKALVELEALRKRIMARRKGKPLPPAWRLIRQARDDLSKRL